MKKILAIMLAVFMLVSVFSVNVFAVDETEEDPADVEKVTEDIVVFENEDEPIVIANPWETAGVGNRWGAEVKDFSIELSKVKEFITEGGATFTCILSGDGDGTPNLMLSFDRFIDGKQIPEKINDEKNPEWDIAIPIEIKPISNVKDSDGKFIVTYKLDDFVTVAEKAGVKIDDMSFFLVQPWLGNCKLVSAKFTVMREPEEKEIVVYSKDEPLALGAPWDTCGVGNRWGGEIKDFDISLTEIKNIISEGGATFVAVIAYDGNGLGDSNLLLSFEKYADGVKDDANGTEIKIKAASRTKDENGNYVVTFKLDEFLPVLEKAGVKIADMPFFVLQSGFGEYDFSADKIINEGKLVSAKFVITKTGDEEPETVVAKRNSGVIYIDEEYHGMLVNGHLLTYPHEADNALGYCPVCNAIIEANEEVEVEVVDPTEPGDVETETDEPTIDVTEPEQPTEEEKNPPMGIAFAVLPMAVAAAALVSSKRR